MCVSHIWPPWKVPFRLLWGKVGQKPFRRGVEKTSQTNTAESHQKCCKMNSTIVRDSHPSASKITPRSQKVPTCAPKASKATFWHQQIQQIAQHKIYFQSHFAVQHIRRQHSESATTKWRELRLSRGPLKLPFRVARPTEKKTPNTITARAQERQNRKSPCLPNASSKTTGVLASSTQEQMARRSPRSACSRKT